MWRLAIGMLLILYNYDLVWEVRHFCRRPSGARRLDSGRDCAESKRRSDRVLKSPGNLTSSGARSRHPGGVSPGNPYILLTAYYWLYEAAVELLVAFWKNIWTWQEIFLNCTCISWSSIPLSLTLLRAWYLNSAGEWFGGDIIPGSQNMEKYGTSAS